MATQAIYCHPPHLEGEHGSEILSLYIKLSISIVEISLNIDSTFRTDDAIDQGGQSDRNPFCVDDVTSDKD